MDLIKHLLQFPTGSPGTKNLWATLLSDKEERHSDVLAWLLEPNGHNPGVFLQALLQTHRPDILEWGAPFKVEREVTKGSDRPDVVLRWSNNKTVLLENKINAREGRQQCSRYLESFEINTEAEGHLFFLTWEGKWPKSIKTRDDPRVSTLSYHDVVSHLRICVGGGLYDPQPRQRALVMEYIEYLEDLLGMSKVTERPDVSPRTLAIVEHEEEVRQSLAQASKTSTNFIKWAVSNSEKELAKAIEGIELRVLGSTFLYTCPAWTTPSFRLGVAYTTWGSELDSKGLLTINAYQHRVAVRVVRGQEVSDQDLKDFTQRLSSRLVRGWPGERIASDTRLPRLGVRGKDHVSNNKLWPVYSDVPFKDNDWDGWAKHVEDALVAFTEHFGDILDQHCQDERDSAR